MKQGQKLEQDGIIKCEVFGVDLLVSFLGPLYLNSNIQGASWHGCFEKALWLRSLVATIRVNGVNVFA